MMARVRGVMAASTAAGSILNVSGSMSTNTGVPPALWIVPAVAKNVNGVVMTSSPGLKPSALRGRSSASVPLAQAIPCVAWESLASSPSSRGTAGPMTNCCDSMTACTAGRTSSLMARYCATRSSNGTFMVSLCSPPGRRQLAEGAVRLFIGRATRGAGGRAVRRQEPLAALAHPPYPARGHAHHERVRRHVGGHDGAGADERVLAERHPAHDRGIGADRAAAFHQRGAVLVLARHVAAGVEHVGEHAGRPAEHVILEGDALVDRHVVLDLDVVADAGAGHHRHVLPEIAALADHGPGHHVAEVPDLRALADPSALVDVARFVDEVLRHLDPDHLDLELDAGFLRDGLADVLDDLEHVARGRVRRVDDVVRVQRRHLRGPDGEALQAALVDQRSGGARAARVLEHRPAARLVERRSRLAPAEQPALHFLELRGRLLDERQLRLEHDDA